MDEAELGQLDRMRATLTGEGIPVQRLRAEEVVHRVPGLDPTGILGGTFLGSDGTLYPFPAVWGLYEKVRSLGVEVRLGTEAEKVRIEDGRVAGIVTPTGRITAPVVVNAAGGWSGELSRRAGLAVPNTASRHEILATEPLKPFLTPMVVRLRDGLYFSQTMRGEIVGGLTLPHPAGTAAGVPSSIAFLRAFSKAITGLLPALASLGVLRAWSGFYDDTPDGLPVLGEDPRLPGFVHANGFGGHGFMLAPASARRVAALVMGERTDLDPARFGPARFQSATPLRASERIQLG
jgi:sarcosine oxidase, subunit beta